MSNLKKIIVAIDGYSSCGKSTIAKELAKKVGYIYVDSGAMYRAVALYCIENHIIKNNEVDIEKLKTQLPLLQIEFRTNTDDGTSQTYLNGQNVEQKIRSLQVAETASQISTIPFVRQAMVNLQQQLGQSKGIVMDGRDIGTVVFPDAELKIFVTASPSIRAERRFNELKALRKSITLDEVMKNVEERDLRDTHRTISPLQKADDAIILDNSNMTKDEQMQWVLNAFEKALKNHHQTTSPT
ncbi:MAG: (d)CMP kinase [Microbacter sp.]